VCAFILVFGANPSILVSAFFSKIWKRLHGDIEPPTKVKNASKKSDEKPAASNEANASVNSTGGDDELKRFRDNITKITGNLSGGNMMNSMMMGGFDPKILNAMGGGANQSIMAASRAQGDQAVPDNHTEV
jgi:hypothetical protein